MLLRGGVVVSTLCQSAQRPFFFEARNRAKYSLSTWSIFSHQEGLWWQLVTRLQLATIRKVMERGWRGRIVHGEGHRRRRWLCHDISLALCARLVCWTIIILHFWKIVPRIVTHVKKPHPGKAYEDSDCAIAFAVVHWKARSAERNVHLHFSVTRMALVVLSCFAQQAILA